MSTRYCDTAPHDPVHADYHATEYGFPASDERVLFERLTLEIAQAGLNWGLILKKRAGYRAAFADWDVDAVAAFGEADLARCAADAGIVRNRLKIAATVRNAARIREMRVDGGFAAVLEAAHPMALGDWVKWFRQRFKFVGPEIVNEFLMSLGLLPGAHATDCPIFDVVAALDPPWMRAEAAGFTGWAQAEVLNK